MQKRLLVLPCPPRKVGPRMQKRLLVLPCPPIPRRLVHPDVGERLILLEMCTRQSESCPSRPARNSLAMSCTARILAAYCLQCLSGSWQSSAKPSGGQPSWCETGRPCCWQMASTPNRFANVSMSSARASASLRKRCRKFLVARTRLHCCRSRSIGPLALPVSKPQCSCSSPSRHLSLTQVGAQTNPGVSCFPMRHKSSARLSNVTACMSTI